MYLKEQLEHYICEDKYSYSLYERRRGHFERFPKTFKNLTPNSSSKRNSTSDLNFKIGRLTKKDQESLSEFHRNSERRFN